MRTNEKLRRDLANLEGGRTSPATDLRPVGGCRYPPTGLVGQTCDPKGGAPVHGGGGLQNDVDITDFAPFGESARLFSKRCFS